MLVTTEERQIIDDLFEDDATVAYTYLSGLIKQCKLDADNLLEVYECFVEASEEDKAGWAWGSYKAHEDEWRGLSKVLAEKVVEKVERGEIVGITNTDAFVAELLGFDLTLLH